MTLVTDASIGDTAQVLIPVEEEGALSDTSIPSLELDDMNGAHSDWELRPIPTE